MSLKSAFSKKVFYARQEKGYSQDDLAEAVSSSTRWIQKIEKGTVIPGGEITIRLILSLDLDVNDLREVAELRVPVSKIQRKP